MAWENQQGHKTLKKYGGGRMNPKIILHLTPEGVEPPQIQASSEQEQAIAMDILEKIQPEIDIIDAILKKTCLGPRG